MTKLKSETIRYDMLGGESGNLLDDLKAWVIFFRKYQTFSGYEASGPPNFVYGSGLQNDRTDTR